MFKIDLRNRSHMEVSLENDQAKFYASLHFHHSPQIGGPEPDVDKIHGYMLDPNRGSLHFTLVYDPG